MTSKKIINKQCFLNNQPVMVVGYPRKSKWLWAITPFEYEFVLCPMNISHEKTQ
jgi:hypothetical protein